MQMMRSWFDGYDDYDGLEDSDDPDVYDGFLPFPFSPLPFLDEFLDDFFF